VLNAGDQHMPKLNSRILANRRKAAFLRGLTVLAYLPGAPHGFIWDDDAWLMHIARSTA